MTTALRKRISEAGWDRDAWKTATPEGQAVAKQLEIVKQATSDVQLAIRRYEEALAAIAAVRDVPDKVRQLAKRGLATAQRAQEQWNGIADDYYVIAMAMPQDRE
jgi:hypothetical protein